MRKQIRLFIYELFLFYFIEEILDIQVKSYKKGFWEGVAQVHKDQNEWDKFQKESK